MKLEKTLEAPYEQVLARIPEVLAAEGFGVVTRIDMGETLKAKLGVNFRRYTIFGACNPALAHRALCADPRVGVFLPCNVAVYETEDGKTAVNIVDPLEAMANAPEAALREIAAEAHTHLSHALFRLG
jgi:uncharacterized protein (DUF302 family)